LALIPLVAAHALAAPSTGEVVARVGSTAVRSSDLDPPPGWTETRSGLDHDEWLALTRARRLEQRVVASLRKEFCRDHGCELTADEKRKVRATLKKLEDAKATDIGRERKTIEKMFLSMAAAKKFHKALYERYGGEVISQVLGVNAVGAYRRWLEDEERRGRFQITNAALRDDFYRAVSGYGGGRPTPEQARDAFARIP
jgi:hypothetical protein